MRREVGIAPYGMRLFYDFCRGGFPYPPAGGHGDPPLRVCLISPSQQLPLTVVVFADNPVPVSVFSVRVKPAGF